MSLILQFQRAFLEKGKQKHNNQIQLLSKQKPQQLWS